MLNGRKHSFTAPPTLTSNFDIRACSWTYFWFTFICLKKNLNARARAHTHAPLIISRQLFREFTCYEQSSVPAGLGPPGLQTHEADLQLLLVALRAWEHPAVPGFLYHDGGRTCTELLIYCQAEDNALPARPGGSIGAAERRREEMERGDGEEERDERAGDWLISTFFSPHQLPEKKEME